MTSVSHGRWNGEYRTLRATTDLLSVRSFSLCIMDPECKMCLCSGPWLTGKIKTHRSLQMPFGPPMHLGRLKVRAGSCCLLFIMPHTSPPNALSWDLPPPLHCLPDIILPAMGPPCCLMPLYHTHGTNWAAWALTSALVCLTLTFRAQIKNSCTWKLRLSASQYAWFLWSAQFSNSKHFLRVCKDVQKTRALCLTVSSCLALNTGPHETAAGAVVFTWLMRHELIIVPDH